MSGLLKSTLKESHTVRRNIHIHFKNNPSASHNHTHTFFLHIADTIHVIHANNFPFPVYLLHRDIAHPVSDWYLREILWVYQPLQLLYLTHKDCPLCHTWQTSPLNNLFQVGMKNHWMEQDQMMQKHRQPPRSLLHATHIVGVNIFWPRSKALSTKKGR